MDADRQGPVVELGSEYVELAVEVFSLLADATRVRLVVALSGGERSVGELAALVGKPAPAVSQHLAKLRWGRVVQARQEANRVYYRLVDEHAWTLVQQAVFQAEHVVSVAPPHHRRSGGADGARLRDRGVDAAVADHTDAGQVGVPATAEPVRVGR